MYPKNNPFSPYRARFESFYSTYNPLRQYQNNHASLFGEDGVIEFILSKLEGFDNVVFEMYAGDGLYGSRSYNLIKNRGWGGTLIEPDKEKFEKLKRLHKGQNDVVCSSWKYPTKLDKNQIFSEIDFPSKQPGLFAITMNGLDYYFWEKLDDIQPAIFLVQFNPTIPNDVYFVQEESTGLTEGCSLSALAKLGHAKNYRLAFCTHNIALFVATENLKVLGINANLNFHHFMHTPLNEKKFFYDADGELHTVGCKQLYYSSNRVIRELYIKKEYESNQFLRYFNPTYTLVYGHIGTIPETNGELFDYLKEVFEYCDRFYQVSPVPIEGTVNVLLEYSLANITNYLLENKFDFIIVSKHFVFNGYFNNGIENCWNSAKTLLHHGNAKTIWEDRTKRFIELVRIARAIWVPRIDFISGYQHIVPSEKLFHLPLVNFQKTPLTEEGTSFEYDLHFGGSMSKYRLSILDKISKAGLNILVTRPQDMLPKSRDIEMKKARTTINLRTHDIKPFTSIMRVYTSLCQGNLVLSEKTKIPGELDKYTITFSNIDDVI
ncbi:hypothetical protein N9V13_05030, partial [Betaproteobacteria bacterium]|nr:hypothetical protein [Betaproteobacteria bacterium]